MSDNLLEFEELASAISERLARNRRVRRNLPGKGRVRIDRQLPFLCVYRRPVEHDDPGTRELVTTEAAYLLASANPQWFEGLSRLCRQIVETLQEHFGAFLLIEIWAGDDAHQPHSAAARREFRIVTPDEEAMPAMVEALQESLEEISVDRWHGAATVEHREYIAPPGLPPLIDSAASGPTGCFCVGLEVPPIYRSSKGTLYPLRLQSLRRQLAPAIRKAVHAFSDSEPNNHPPHYHALGPTMLAKAARLVDQRLGEVSESFNLLLQVTPVNGTQAWQEFSESGYRKTPKFFYRPMPFHPNLLKRQLFDIRIERVEDATLAQIFWEKQDELGREIAALRDLDTPRFLYSSLQLYEPPDAELVRLAESIFSAAADRDPGRETEQRSRGIPARQIAKRAREEIDYYHQRMPSFTVAVELCDHIASGMLVAKDRLYISEHLRTSPRGMAAMLHHEVGTHLLTYFNGRSQPFQQLYAGLAGYEPLQEGLAVLSEYLTGGMTPKRLRRLAARVLAVRARIEGCSFAETFQMLHEAHRFSPRSAFTVALRVFRGGGFTKDAIYLAGLRDLLAYLAHGHDIEPLYVGKIALEHVPFVQELRRREIVRPPALLPRFWNDDAEARRRLEECRGRTVLEMMDALPATSRDT